MQTYYVTKYCLTEGIQSATGEVSNRYLYAKISDEGLRIQFPPGHYHATKEAARQKAVKMAEGKIKSLEKQLQQTRELLREFQTEE